MIVTCSNCQTKYNLPEDKIAPGGSKVKCSRCSHLFKVIPPSAAVEEDVEALLEQEAPVEKAASESDFDAAFDEAKAEQKEAAPAAAEAPAEEESEPSFDSEPSSGVDAPPEDDFSDLFDDQEGDEPPAEADPEETLFEGGEEELFEEEPAETVAAEAQEEGSDDTGMDSLFADDDDDAESADDGDDLFADSDDDDEDDDVNGVLFEESLDLDTKPKRSKLGLILVLIFLLLIGGAVYFKVWNMLGIDIGSSLQGIPYVGTWLSGDTPPDAEPGESPEQRVNKIELRNVRQFYAKNEKAGVLFIIQGTAINNFDSPKERIEVQAQLFDAKSTVVASEKLLCGNVLSMFQLQVQSRKEIEDGLKSEVGILSNNTFLRPGASTPFMFVFFEQPVNDIKEFGVKVVDAQTPK